MSSSLGYHPNSRAQNVKPRQAQLSVDINKKVVPTLPSEPPPTQTFSIPVGSISLITLNALLFLAHTSIAVVTATTPFNFPVTVFETRLTDDVLTQFQCVFDYGRNEDNEYYCTNVEWTQSGTRNATAECTPFMTNYSAGDNVFVAPSGGPLLQVYRLTRFTLGPLANADVDGRHASKWLIFAIEAVTAIFHIVYLIAFVRVYAQDRANAFSLLNKLTRDGGILARWYEYALTASLMSVIIGNTANVFELYALVAFALGTFALMFNGIVIERTLYEGRTQTALLFLYIPGTALFALTWLPLIRQLFTDVLKLICHTWQRDSPLSCSDYTCFGREMPIPVFVMTLTVLFCLFPIVTLIKVYFVGGYADKWGEPFRSCYTSCMCGATRTGRTTVRINMLFTHCALFVVFVVWGACLATWRLIADILGAMLPFRAFDEPVATPTTEVKRDGLFLGEVLYLLLSATSKIFLAIYFLAAFSQRDW